MKKTIYMILDKDVDEWLRDEATSRLHAYPIRGDAVFAREEFCNILGLNPKDYPVYKFVMESK